MGKVNRCVYDRHTDVRGLLFPAQARDARLLGAGEEWGRMAESPTSRQGSPADTSVLLPSKVSAVKLTTGAADHLPSLLASH